MNNFSKNLFTYILKILTLICTYILFNLNFPENILIFGTVIISGSVCLPNEHIVGNIIEMSTILEPRTSRGDVIGGALAFDFNQDC